MRCDRYVQMLLVFSEWNYMWAHLKSNFCKTNTCTNMNQTALTRWKMVQYVVCSKICVMEKYNDWLIYNHPIHMWYISSTQQSQTLPLCITIFYCMFFVQSLNGRWPSHQGSVQRTPFNVWRINIVYTRSRSLHRMHGMNGRAVCH